MHIPLISEGKDKIMQLSSYQKREGEFIAREMSQLAYEVYSNGSNHIYWDKLKSAANIFINADEKNVLALVSSVDEASQWFETRAFADDFNYKKAMHLFNTLCLPFHKYDVYKAIKEGKFCDEPIIIIQGYEKSECYV